MRKLLLIIVVALLWGTGASDRAKAAPPARFSVEAWGPDRGLRSSGVISLIQSDDGFLWLGTLKGLIRFDGVNFTPFEQDDAAWLNSSRVVRLFEDHAHRLWVGTESDGVALITEKGVQRPEIGRHARDGRLVTALEDSTGAVWLLSADGVLYRWREGKTEQWPLHKPIKLAADKSGPLWLVDENRLGLYRIDPSATFTAPERIGILRTNAAREITWILPRERGGFWLLADGHVQKWSSDRLEADYGPYPWRQDSHPATAACEDRDGDLIIGTYRQGLFWFGPDGQATAISKGDGLVNDTVLSLCVDREGILWIGTDGGGLNRVMPKVFKVLDASRELTPQSVSEDAQGALWYGAFGGGLNVWKDGRTNTVYYLRGAERFTLSPKAVLVARDQTVWVANESLGFVTTDQTIWANLGAGLYRAQTNGSANTGGGAGANYVLSPGLRDDLPLPWNISALHEDRAGRLWIGAREGLACWHQDKLQIFTTTNGLSANDVRSLADDAAGTLWIGTRGGGLNRLKDGQFTAYRHHDLDGPPGDDIASLVADDEGALWVGTPDRGLARLRDEKWTRYTREDGLPNNGLGNLIDDGRGNLWMESDAGVIRIPKKALNDFALNPTNTLPCTVYGRSDGLPTAESIRDYQPGPCRAHDGRIWFPTTKGLASINPADIYLNTNPPPVVIESVLVEGRDQNTNGLRGRLPETITLRPGQSRLDILFTALNLRAPDRSRLEYRLGGHESEWTDLGNARPGVARYTRLPPGPYRFEIKAANEDGVWNEVGAVLNVVVEPPFWRTGWFITLATLGLLGMVTYVVHYFSTQRLQRQLEGLRQQHALERERQRIARDIHDQLGASLTQVAMLGELVESDKDLPEEVEAHARQIQHSARDTSRVLDEIVWAVNPSNDTLEGLINYFCKYAQEYLTVAALKYRLDVPAQLPATPIPPDLRHNVFLAAKEAVTNVVRHSKATSCWIRMRLEPGSFILEIEDNGAGMAGMDEKRAKTRNGLSNMRKRLEEVGGSCTFSPGAEGGTLVRLVAPRGPEH